MYCAYEINCVCLQSGRIGADEEIDDTKGKTMEEVEEMIEEREFKAGAQILEMVQEMLETMFSNCCKKSLFINAM